MNKKTTLFIITFLMSIILVISLYFVIQIQLNKLASKKCMDSISEFTKLNSETIFSINKITYFSSANGEVSVNPNSSFTVSDLNQYTDIALFINNNNNDNLNAKNTLKNVKLSNIKYDLLPSIGSCKLYYKNINDFTKNTFEEKNIVNDSLDFSISSEDEIDYSSPILFNNCANPITLCYVNSNLKPNYTLPSGTNNISYDGKLLKNCNITLNSIACKISFLITIVNNLDETYTCPVILDIPLSTEDSTIYDGSLILNDNTNYNFIRIK